MFFVPLMIVVRLLYSNYSQVNFARNQYFLTGGKCTRCWSLEEEGDMVHDIVNHSILVLIISPSGNNISLFVSM